MTPQRQTGQTWPDKTKTRQRRYTRPISTQTILPHFPSLKLITLRNHTQTKIHVLEKINETNQQVKDQQSSTFKIRKMPTTKKNKTEPARGAIDVRVNETFLYSLYF